MNHLQAALRYLNHGLAPIPIWPDKRKNPRLSSTQKYTHELPSERDVRRWWARWPDANIGLITGYWLNYVALDFDDRRSYERWKAEHGIYTRNTWIVATARGYHVWFQVGDDPGSSRSFVCGDCHVLLRAKGGYCIVPPSVHHSGKRYRTIVNLMPAQEELTEILRGWQPVVQKKQKTRPEGPNLGAGGQIAGMRIEELIPIPEGSKPQGRHGAYQVFCPFHEDSKPSAWINVEQQRFGCNACWPGRWWDVVNVYGRLQGLSNGEAYKRFIERS